MTVVKQYVTSVQKGKVTNKSFSVVAGSCGDALFEVKANIFLSIANNVAHFLYQYQTDMPMLPFLAPERTQPIQTFSPSLLVSHAWISFFMTAWPLLLSELICGT